MKITYEYLSKGKVLEIIADGEHVHYLYDVNLIEDGLYAYTACTLKGDEVMYCVMKKDVNIMNR